MRPVLLVLPVVLSLLADGMHPTPGLSSLAARPAAATPDTGESLRRPIRAPIVACPMPVERTDPANVVPMPTERTRSPLSRGTVVDSAPPGGSSGMPIVRSGCRNPLDQPMGEGDSVRIEGEPRR